VQVIYQLDGKSYLYWAHLDDDSEIAAFAERSGVEVDEQVEILKVIKAKEARRRTRSAARRRRKQLKDALQKGQLSKIAESSAMLDIKFPKLRADEMIVNVYAAGDHVEMVDEETGDWARRTVTESHNNWIMVDGCDARLHVSTLGEQLRRAGREYASSVAASTGSSVGSSVSSSASQSEDGDGHTRCVSEESALSLCDTDEQRSELGDDILEIPGLEVLKSQSSMSDMSIDSLASTPVVVRKRHVAEAGHESVTFDDGTLFEATPPAQIASDDAEDHDDFFGDADEWEIVEVESIAKLKAIV
jgi:hypothetical protein